jgi:hypothetical protein
MKKSIKPIPSFAGMTKKKIPSFAGMTILFFFSFFLMFHTFSYDGATHSIQIAYKLWSDFGAHIPLIRSFSLGDNFPNPWTHTFVQYPIFPGPLIRYHFLFYLFVGILERIGIRIDWALNVPSALGFFLLLTLLYIIAKKLFSSSAIGILTILFFLFNGSLGFLRFFMLHPVSLHTLDDIVHAKAFPAFAPWGQGDVTAFWNLNIYTNQRHLSLAFALVLFFILQVIQDKRYTLSQQILRALPWGIGFGLLPFFHQPALLILAIFIACYFVLYPRQRTFLLIVGVLTAIVVLPQIVLTGAGATSVQWYPGYIIHNDLVAQKQVIQIIARIVSFWWQNLGLHSMLIVIGFPLIPCRARKALIPIIPLFLIANCFKFSVEASANHKFFNFMMMLGQMISAYVLVRLFHAIRRHFRHSFIRLFVYSFISLLFIPLTLSGVIDFFVIVNDTKGSVSDIPKNEVAVWIGRNTPPDAVFLNSSYLYHPASIAGRPIFLGWPYFPWSAGYKENRMPIARTMYETHSATTRCALLSKYNISYITVEDVKNDSNLPRIDYAYFRDHFTPVFVSKDDRYAIYTEKSLCP